MIKQFIVYLMNSCGLKEHRVNCANEFSAIQIARAIYKDYGVIDCVEV